jgi:NAD(P)-dependent dehydrogenase (short-subunit alcohol dehydrogenase family)
MSRAVWPHLMAAGGGAIINMSSQAAGMGMTGALRERITVLPSASYFVAKAGIEAFTRYIAGLGAPHNIRVNCVRPGQILTAKLTTATGEHFYKPYHEVVQMLSAPGQPVDVANTVVFLASEAPASLRRRSSILMGAQCARCKTPRGGYAYRGSPTEGGTAP